jgi:hypothetical protein
LTHISPNPPCSSPRKPKIATSKLTFTVTPRAS